MASERIQGAQGSPEMIPRWPKMAPSSPKIVPRWHQHGPRRALPECWKTISFYGFFGFREPRDGPKMAPIRAQHGSV